MQPPGAATLAFSTAGVLGLTVVAALAVWTRDARPGIVLVSGLALMAAAAGDAIRRRALLIWFVAALALGAGGALRSTNAWAEVAPDQLGPFNGWVRVVDDPQPYGTATRVIAEVDGERFEVWARGRAFRQRVGRWRGGEWIRMAGTRVALEPDRARRVAWQHVVGGFTVDWASDEHPGGPLDRASNRVRGAIEKAATVLPADDAALFRGLVIGDDRDQSRVMIERFRASGLSHLTAVSGQNVAFVLAAAGPLLVRLRPIPRWLVTLGLIGWFVSLTRFEPSIVRAGAMASLSSTAYLLGALRRPIRNLGLAVMVLVLVDPLIVWSIGFWLSVGATAGVTAGGPWLAARLTVLRSWATPVGVTLGAQLGVALPSLLVFGRLPLVSVPANLLAVPVAGAVMLYGLPAGIVAGSVPALAPLLMFPARLGTRWVDTVAAVAARVEPSPGWAAIGWILAVLGLAGCGIWAQSARQPSNN